MLTVRAWGVRGAGALAAVALAGCGVFLGARAPVHPRPAAKKPAVSRSAKTPPASARPTPCPTWLVRDVKLASSVKLPVPTQQLAGFGAGRMGEATVKAWLGGSSQQSVREVLDDWRISGLSATQGSEALTLLTYRARHVFPFGRGNPGTALLLSLPGLSEAQRAEIAHDGLPTVPSTGPVQLTITVNTVVPPGTLAAELGAFLGDIHGDLGSLADSYPVAAPPPSGYVTYAGPTRPRDLAHVLQVGCAGEPVATIAPDVVSGAVVQVRYWSSTEANGISLGFAPGRVVVESETDAMTQVGWYAEPAITVPPIP